MLTGMARAPKPSSCEGYRVQESLGNLGVPFGSACTTSAWTCFCKRGPARTHLIPVAQMQVLRVLVSVQRCLKPEDDFGVRFGRKGKILASWIENFSSKAAWSFEGNRDQGRSTMYGSGTVAFCLAEYTRKLICGVHVRCGDRYV